MKSLIRKRILWSAVLAAAAGCRATPQEVKEEAPVALHEPTDVFVDASRHLERSEGSIAHVRLGGDARFSDLGAAVHALHARGVRAFELVVDGRPTGTYALGVEGEVPSLVVSDLYLNPPTPGRMSVEQFVARGPGGARHIRFELDGATPVGEVAPWLQGSIGRTLELAPHQGPY
jgi:hypothetical protein